MTNIKVDIYSSNNLHIGYFLNPKIETYPGNEYEISGHFYDVNNQIVSKLEFNPQALPYTADLSNIKEHSQVKVFNVYLQRGRQPICMTGSGT